MRGGREEKGAEESGTQLYLLTLRAVKDETAL